MITMHKCYYGHNDARDLYYVRNECTTRLVQLQIQPWALWDSLKLDSSIQNVNFLLLQTMTLFMLKTNVGDLPLHQNRPLIQNKLLVHIILYLSVVTSVLLNFAVSRLHCLPPLYSCSIRDMVLF